MNTGLLAKGLSSLAVDVMDGAYDSGDGFLLDYLRDDIEELFEDCEEPNVDYLDLSVDQ